jgi:hypothetical protein
MSEEFGFSLLVQLFFLLPMVLFLVLSLYKLSSICYAHKMVRSFLNDSILVKPGLVGCRIVTSAHI